MIKFLNLLLKGTLTLFFNLLFKIIGEPRRSKSLQQAINLYSNQWFAALFARIRAWDSPHELINRNIPSDANILDLGSGDGLMANYLALFSPKRKVLGIEMNKDRVRESDKGIANVTFKQGNVLIEKLPKSDITLLIHVLHHLPTKKDQIKLLNNIYNQNLKKKGKLIIVEISHRPFYKYLFTYLTDAFIVPILFNKQLYDFNFHYRKIDEWIEELEQIGFTAKYHSTHQGMPFSHVYIEARKNEN